MFARSLAAAVMMMTMSSAYAADPTPARNSVLCENQNKGKHENAATDCERPPQASSSAAVARDPKSGHHSPGEANAERTPVPPAEGAARSPDAKGQRHAPGVAGEE